MLKTCFWSVSLLFVMTAALQAQSRESLLKALAQNSQWSPAGKLVQYDGKNIETLAGRRAAIIKDYGFAGATVQDWNGPNGKVRLTLYEMADAAAAYGFFTLERGSEQAGLATLSVGTDGFRAGNREFFWQSKYLVRLDGMPAATDALA